MNEEQKRKEEKKQVEQQQEHIFSEIIRIGNILIEKDKKNMKMKLDEQIKRASNTHQGNSNKIEHEGPML